eukprot:scaffold65355_cov21-Tisochrysis_lutea.AAC.1
MMVNNSSSSSSSNNNNDDEQQQQQQEQPQNRDSKNKHRQEAGYTRVVGWCALSRRNVVPTTQVTSQLFCDLHILNVRLPWPAEADVKAMFGDEAQLEPEGAAGPDESAEVSKLLSFPDAAPEAQNVDVEALVCCLLQVVLGVRPALFLCREFDVGRASHLSEKLLSASAVEERLIEKAENTRQL